MHPSDRYLLGMRWRSQYYEDLALPFGLCSAPYLFNSVADMVEWILLNLHDVSNLLHYLDDFITAGPPNSDQCALNLSTSVRVCKSLGFPLHPNKCIGPSTVLVVLGVELVSNEHVVRLPTGKLLALQELIASWLSRRWCTRRQLESLIGHLHYAAKVVWFGRTIFVPHDWFAILQAWPSHPPKFWVPVGPLMVVSIPKLLARHLPLAVSRHVCHPWPRGYLRHLRLVRFWRLLPRAMV